VRLFAAFDLSNRTRDAVAAEQRRIASSLGGAAASPKWIPPDRAHLTLVFLGQVDDNVVPPLVQTMSQDVEAAPFEITFSGRGVFPPRGAPRVLWVGVKAGIDQLILLHREMVRRVVGHGIELEAREYHPHLTLGRWRVSRPSDATRALSAAKRDTLAQETVTRVTLFESRLSSSGPVYTALAHANLTAT
jgi:RNA 2',3'-cyclic 3'-phosphodiesterase